MDGTLNLTSDGSLYEGLRENGLYRIAPDFSGIETIDADLAVWNIFKDTDGVIWIGSREGILRRAPGGTPLFVCSSSTTGLYPEQILEFEGQVYAVLKNFFHNPSVVSGDRRFELWRWNPVSGQFARVCDIDAGADNTFTRVGLPDAACEGIRSFAVAGKVVYGAARQKLYFYENGAWAEFCDLEIGNDIREMKIANRHLFVVSGWNSSGAGRTGGMEVVDLRERTTGYYDSTRIPIPADALFAIEIQGFDNDTFKLWLGGPNGVAYCEFRDDE